jgi:GntR family transcriptional regulator
MTSESGGTPARRGRDPARRIRDLIRADMHRGAYKDGRLPSEEQLMRQMHVPRSTIRGAFALLRDEGLIDRIQGIGTVVAVELTTMTLEESQGVTPFSPGTPFGRSRPQVISHVEVELPPPITRHLGIPLHSVGTRIDYLALYLEAPVAVITNYIRNPEAQRLASAAFTTDYYSYLADAGIVTSETTYLMEAALADDVDAELLGVPVGSPMMLGEQALLNESGEQFNYAFVRSRGDMSAILSRARRAAAPEITGGPAADQL